MTDGFDLKDRGSIPLASTILIFRDLRFEVVVIYNKTYNASVNFRVCPVSYGISGMASNTQNF